MRATGKFAAWTAVCAALVGTSAAAQSIWAEQPSAADLGQWSPPNGGTASVAAKVRCKVAADGVLSACVVIEENPVDLGFGSFALSLAQRFRATPEAAAKMKDGIVIPLRFESSAAAPPMRAPRFQRSGAFKKLGDAGPYYPDRAARMRQTAVVEADCRVADDNRLHDCRIVSVSNPGYGFEFAFLKMAERGWMTAAAPENVTAPPDGVWRFRMIFDAKRR